MSEKDGHAGVQWSKTKIAPASVSSAIQKHPSFYGLAPMYENSGDIITVPSFASARFQPPSIHHVPTPLTIAPHSPAGLLSPIGTSSHSNVPAPNSFLSPNFSSPNAPTSILTTNPFVTANADNIVNSSVNNVQVHHTTLDQFQHLSPHQQFELSKIMSNAALPIPPTTPSTIGQTPTHSSTRSHSDLAMSSGLITPSIADNVLQAITASQNTSIQGRLIPVGVKMSDDEKIHSLQTLIESVVCEQAKKSILQILDIVTTLKPVEKLLLYLRLPGEAPETDPLRHPQNPLGTRSEINHTINWVRSHLEHDPQVSIPKQDVYNDYIAFCDSLDIKPLSTADFGKVMKQVFPGIRPRRLGTRGHSRYCYAAMRKTTNLPAPQLPFLENNKATNNYETENLSLCTKKSTFLQHTADNESWEIIKSWAENYLNFKVDSFKDLAERIKENKVATNVGNQHRNIGYKKFSQRETKEKRLIHDMGPLKKRRKKKRKGSTSSESSCNQAVLYPKLNKYNNNNNNNNNSNAKDLSANSGNADSVRSPSDDEQKSLKLVEVKQEILDSPNLQHLQLLPPAQRQSASINDNFIQQSQKQSLVTQQQHQVMPINLVTEQRTILAKTPLNDVAFSPNNNVNLRSTYSAVKNLTPKIMEMSTVTNSNIVSSEQSQIQTIKEEVIDDYNPSNIFCKKVRKAQQTKGFWVNSPITNNTPTTTARTTSPPTIIVNATQNTSVVTTAIGDLESSVANYSMGPPAPTLCNTSTSPSSSVVEGNIAKVASRNMIMLRAKKLQAAAGNITPDIDKNADLSESLGLPRERVISICNMDKHELDGYFLPGDEENSQDQDSELLQYFQTGDAEEKLNSLDAAKNRNAIAKQMPSVTKEPKLRDETVKNLVLEQKNYSTTPKKQSCEVGKSTISSFIVGKNTVNNDVTKGFASTDLNVIPSITSAVGSASASLALMSQKHQQQHQLQHQVINSNNNKRKVNINKNALIDTPFQLRKNCIFLPISPNTCNSTCSSNVVSSVSFTNPVMSRFRSKPSFLKQQSLTNDCSDPMIGASRKRRILTSNLTTNSTSASAPPSPSLLQKQLQQKPSLVAHSSFFNDNHWQINSNITYGDDVTNSGLLNEQNSLDLDLFTEGGVGNGYTQNNLTTNNGESCQFVPLTETQRSHSVPLSQLQREHSPIFNRNFQADFSVCSSVVATPVVPGDFGDTTIFSENSSSQNSTSKNQVNTSKLEDTVSLLQDVDVSEILNSEFITKFSTINQANTATATCSSSGSSSGYSSGLNFSLGGNIVSRSVPSTPLPHHQNNTFSNGNICNKRHANSEMHFSPTGTENLGSTLLQDTTKYNGNGDHIRSSYDISKSMPSTPITTPCFRFETNRDFLINGNTVDSITSFSGVGSDNFSGSLTCGVINELNANTSFDENCSGLPTDAFGNMNGDTEAIIVGADILGNL